MGRTHFSWKSCHERPEQLQTTNGEESGQLSAYRIYSRMLLSFMAVRAVRHLRTCQLIHQVFNRTLVVRHVIVGAAQMGLKITQLW